MGIKCKEGSVRAMEIIVQRYWNYITSLDDKPLVGFAKWKVEKAKQGPIADEYTQYYESALCPVEVDARSWWLEST